tara:strand:- start:351 stop:527 length:177 start_codon:yes stop_codon:yes gene_type:complete
MNITSAKYMADIKTGENACINIVSEGKLISVPLDPDNSHYQTILEWAKEDGNEIAEAD